MIIKFDCTKYTKIKKGETKIPNSVNIIYAEQGGIDLNDMRNSKFPNYLSEIPETSQKELNEKGETTFTVTDVKIVRLVKSEELIKSIKL